jgi:glycosyltransferase involved in cell wall biosynthesis
MQVVPALEMGGVERGTVEIAQALAKAGWGALVVSAGGPMIHELDRAGAKHIVLPVDSKNPLVMVRMIKRLADLIDEHGVSLVHARSRAPAWVAQAAAKRRRRPFVTTYHGTYDVGTPFKYWYGKVMTHGVRVIAISNFIAEHVKKVYRGIDPGRIVVIPRGVDIQRFDPERVAAHRMIELSTHWRLTDGMPVVMLPGRLTRWKGQLVLLDAIARLGRKDVQCVLVGSDQGRHHYRRELEAAIRDKGLAGSVRIVDDCKDMPAAYMLADVVVSASTDPEAFGRIAAEAQAMGRPVIATDHGGSRETVERDKTGWLVPPDDSAALAAAILDALALTAAERNVLARLGRDRIVHNFTVERMQAATLDLYRAILADWPAAPSAAA